MSQLHAFTSLPINSNSMNGLSSVRQQDSNKKMLIAKGKAKRSANIKRIERVYTENPQRASQVKKVNNQQECTTVDKNIFGLSKNHKNLMFNQLHFSKPKNNHLECTLTREALLKENLQLKVTINQLKEDLAIEKVNTEAQRKKNKTFTSKLNREFKKDFYYYQLNSVSNNLHVESDEDSLGTSNYRGPNPEPQSFHSSSYLIAGIKNQYETLKQKHQILESSYQQLKQTDSIQRLQQYKIYIKALEEENAKLSNMLRILKLQSSSVQSERTEGAILELSTKLQKQKGANAKLKQEVKECKKKIKENEKMVQYLEQLVITKNNNEHHYKNKMKFYDKQYARMEKNFHESQEYASRIERTYQQQLADLRHNEEKVLAEKKVLFEEAIFEKNMIIQKLEKQINYLSVVLSYWKPKNFNDEDLLRKSKRKTSESNEARKQPLPQQLEGLNEPSSPSLIIGKKKTDYDEQISKIVGDISHVSVQEERIESERLKQISSRARKNAAIKHSQNCKKTRKVPLEELTNQRQISEFLRYRLIGKGLTIQQVEKYLDWKPIPTSPRSNSNYLDELQEEWNLKYITMKDLKAVFLEEPFKLSAQNSNLLARYIVEDLEFLENDDPSNAFVFVHEENQIERRVAKSILRAFMISAQNKKSSDHENSLVKKTESPQSVAKGLKRELQNEWNALVEKNGSRLKTALISIAPKGVISKSRWNDILSSINIEADTELRQWSIGKMLIDSESLSALQYEKLFGLVPD